MALEVTQEDRRSGPPIDPNQMIEVAEEVWADANGNPVPFNDPRGKSVLFGVGKRIAQADAAKYGIAPDGTFDEKKAPPGAAKEGEPVPSSKADPEKPASKKKNADDEEETATPEPAAKAVPAPPANKAVAGPESSK